MQGDNMTEAKFFIGGHFLDSENKQPVTNKYSGKQIGTYPVADSDLLSMAIASAGDATAAMEAMSSYKRADILDRISVALKAEEDQFIEAITAEAGKPVTAAKAEVRRAQQTFRFAASHARTLEGASIRLDSAAGSETKYGYYLRMPIGIVAAISPFNFPLNLVAHKVAPAIAAGCPVILKPASYTPLTSYLLTEIIAMLDLPPGGFNLVFGSGHDIGMGLVSSNSVRAVTFTGSPEVGMEIAKSAGIKRLILELGSNSAVIVDKSAALESAIPKIVSGGYSYSGQVCISVQRIFVAESIFKEFLPAFVTAVKTIPCGDPSDKKTVVGPMITEGEAMRVESWVNEAVANGARVLAGGKRDGAFYEPTVLADVRPEMKVMSREVFGPVTCVAPFREFDDAIAMVNDSAYGLQAGVFSKDIDDINKAIFGLKVGGVIINDTPTYRADQMPYGGVKMSGLGREGLKYAIEEMTDIRMVAIQR
jgi:acyl-CoA reductase-like NAD-dependent aldehyde dehydrogenase